MRQNVRKSVLRLPQKGQRPLSAPTATLDKSYPRMSFSRDEDNFLMDFENWCLHRCWPRWDFPKGPRRYEQPEWAAMMRRECEDSDTTFERYCEWVAQGGGDEWFQEGGAAK